MQRWDLFFVFANIHIIWTQWWNVVIIKKKLIVAFNIGLVQGRIQVMGFKCIKDEDAFLKRNISTVFALVLRPVWLFYLRIHSFSSLRSSLGAVYTFKCSVPVPLHPFQSRCYYFKLLIFCDSNKVMLLTFAPVPVLSCGRHPLYLLLI